MCIKKSSLMKFAGVTAIAASMVFTVGCSDDDKNEDGDAFRSEAARTFRNKAFMPGLADVTPGAIISADESAKKRRTQALNKSTAQLDGDETVRGIGYYDISHTGTSFMGDAEFKYDESMGLPLAVALSAEEPRVIYELVRAYLQNEKTRLLNEFEYDFQWVSEPNKMFKLNEKFGKYTEENGNRNIYMEHGYYKASISILKNGATSLFMHSDIPAGSVTYPSTLYSVFTDNAYTFLHVTTNGDDTKNIMNLTFDFSGNEKKGRIIVVNGSHVQRLVSFEGNNSNAIFYNKGSNAGITDKAHFFVIKDGFGITYNYRPTDHWDNGPADGLIIDVGAIGNIKEVVFDTNSTVINGEKFNTNIIGFNLTNGKEIRFAKDILKYDEWDEAKDKWIIEGTDFGATAEGVPYFYKGQNGSLDYKFGLSATIHKKKHRWDPGIDYNRGVAYDGSSGINSFLNTLFPDGGLSIGWADEFDTMYNGFGTYFNGWFLDFNNDYVKSLEVNDANIDKIAKTLTDYTNTLIKSNYDGGIFDVLNELTE